MTKNPSPPELTDGELEEMFGAALLKLPGDSLNRAAVAAMRAAIASDRARWSHQPAPPAGELLEEAAWLRNECSAENADGNWISMSIDQALDLASLLERQAAPAPASGEVGELVAALEPEADAQDPATELQWATHDQLRPAADLLEQCQASSVPVGVSGQPDGRDPECVKRWPDCFDGGYDPRCCRFPKSCSCGVRFTSPLPNGEVN